MLLRKSAILLVIIAVLSSMIPMTFAQDGDNTAHLIVAHAVADAPPVDVYVGEVSGTPLVSALVAGAESDKLDLEVGSYTLLVVLAGTRSPILAQGEVELPSVHSTTKVSVGGSVSELPLTLTAELVEEPSEVTETPEAPVTELKSITEIALGDENFSTLVTAVLAADPAVLQAVGGEEPITVFAPPNSAFEALPPGMLDGVLASPPSLQAILLSHVVDGKLTLADLAAMDGEVLATKFMGVTLTVKVESVEGEDAPAISLLVMGDEANAVKLAGVEVEASNGNIIVVESVILPPRPGGDEPTAEPTEEPTTEPTEEPTVAPTEEPTTEPTVEPTEEPTAEPTEEPTVAPTEEPTTEPTVEPTEEPTAEPTEEPTTEPTTPLGTIGDVAAARNDLTTLVAAGGFVGLTDLLIGEDLITVFAPTDETFNASQAAVDLLLSDLDLAANTLKYHVVPGLYTAETLLEMDGQALVSAEGTELNVTVVEGEVFINGLKVTETDILADNGVLHIIDGILLLPGTVPSTEATEEPTTTELPSITDVVLANENFTTLVGAVLTADPAVLEAVGGEGPLTVFAPTNEAFEALPPGLFDAVLASPPSLQAILLSHVVAQDLNVEKLLEMDGEVLETAFPGVTLTVKVETLEGEEAPTVYLLVMGDEANMVKLSGEEFAASNGHVIVIESLIIPPRPEGGDSAPSN